MGLGGPIWSGIGYWFVSITSRIYWRVYDRKIADLLFEALAETGFQRVQTLFDLHGMLPATSIPGNSPVPWNRFGDSSDYDKWNFPSGTRKLE